MPSRQTSMYSAQANARTRPCAPRQFRGERLQQRRLRNLVAMQRTVEEIPLVQFDHLAVKIQPSQFAISNFASPRNTSPAPAPIPA